MKKILKFLFVGFVGLFFILVGFYFWASSPNLALNKYNSLASYNYPSQIKNDSIHSIITYNIGYLSGMTNNLAVEKPKSLFDQNINKVIYELKKADADIIALQEIDFDSNRSFHINQQEEIAKLGYSYAGQNVNWDKKYVPFPYFPFSLHFGKIISGQSVLSKYTIVNQERIELLRNDNNPFYYDSFYLDRLAQVVKININDKILVLINVHLEAYDRETRAKQMQKIKSLYLKYYLDFPTIILGDFNSDTNLSDASIGLLLKLPHMGCAAFDPLGPDNTFSSKSPTKRLDYILYNDNFIQEINGSVLKQFDQASDHLPLQMNFKFKTKQYGTSRKQPDT
jgi:endonuclease/exonuclease/phosphatase family metal-dependent hydrolase